MKPILANKRHIVLFSLLLFAVVQYSALLHASTHFFHTPDNLCSIYSAVDHSKTGVVEHSLSISSIPSRTVAVTTNQHIVTTAYFIFLPSRAPPLL
jgi:hypothetical protein